jgi:hypothetical protein
MLQGIQPEIREFGDFFTRGPDTEDAAGILGAEVVGVEVMGELSVSASHPSSLGVPDGSHLPKIDSDSLS